MVSLCALYVAFCNSLALPESGIFHLLVPSMEDLSLWHGSCSDSMQNRAACGLPGDCYTHVPLECSATANAHKLVAVENHQWGDGGSRLVRVVLGEGKGGYPILLSWPSHTPLDLRQAKAGVVLSRPIGDYVAVE